LTKLDVVSPEATEKALPQLQQTLVVLKDKLRKLIERLETLQQPKVYEKLKNLHITINIDEARKIINLLNTKGHEINKEITVPW